VNGTGGAGGTVGSGLHVTLRTERQGTTAVLVLTGLLSRRDVARVATLVAHAEALAERVVVDPNRIDGTPAGLRRLLEVGRTGVVGGCRPFAIRTGDRLTVLDVVLGSHEDGAA
jgi:hypothetical protein